VVKTWCWSRGHADDWAGAAEWNGREGPCSNVDSPAAKLGVGVYGGGSSWLLVVMLI